jgi:hypothetical protein
MRHTSHCAAQHSSIHLQPNSAGQLLAVCQPHWSAIDDSVWSIYHYLAQRLAEIHTQRQHELRKHSAHHAAKGCSELRLDELIDGTVPGLQWILCLAL